MLSGPHVSVSIFKVMLIKTVGKWNHIWHCVNSCYHLPPHKLYLYKNKLRHSCSGPGITLWLHYSLCLSISSSPSGKLALSWFLCCPDRFFSQPFLLLLTGFVCRCVCHHSLHFSCVYWSDACLGHLEVIWNWILQVFALWASINSLLPEMKCVNEFTVNAPFIQCCLDWGAGLCFGSSAPAVQLEKHTQNGQGGQTQTSKNIKH